MQEGTSTESAVPQYEKLSTYREKRNQHLVERHSKGGLGVRELGDEFGISKSHAHRIVQKAKREIDSEG